MERYLFTADGYRCVDVDGSILHQSEKHEDLFEFVDKDETPLYELLPEYLRLCIDIKTLKPIHDQKKHHIYHQMRDLLFELHPFCSGEYLDREIAVYLNDQLLEATINHSEFPEVNEITEREYKAMFDSLFPAGFGLDGNADDENDYHHFDYYTDYRKKLTGEDEVHVIDSPFHDLHRAKLMIRDFLYWVFDRDAEPFCEMTPAQRLYIYNTYHHPETFRIASAEVDYYWGSAEGIRFDGFDRGIRHEIPLAVQLSSGQYMGEVVQGIASFQEYQVMDPQARTLLNQMIAETMKATTLNEYCAVYGIRNLFTLLFIECQRMYEAKTSIRRCERCGKYFIASKQMYRYCERPIDEESLRTCRDVGARESAKKKLDEDPLYYLYNKAYRTHHARIRAGHITKAEFDAWSTEAKRRMNAVWEDPSLMDEYAAWLKI